MTDSTDKPARTDSLNGNERNDTRECCISEGWVLVPVGMISGTVEPHGR